MNDLNLAPIRDIALRYGTDGMDDEQQQQAVCAIFELCDCIEHVLAYAAEVERLAREHINGIRSGGMSMSNSEGRKRAEEARTDRKMHEWDRSDARQDEPPCKCGHDQSDHMVCTANPDCDYCSCTGYRPAPAPAGSTDDEAEAPVEGAEVSDRHPKWQPVSPGMVIPAGQPYRIEYPGTPFDPINHVGARVDWVMPDSYGPESEWFVDSSWAPPLGTPTYPETVGVPAVLVEALRYEFDRPDRPSYRMTPIEVAARALVDAATEVQR